MPGVCGVESNAVVEPLELRGRIDRRVHGMECHGEKPGSLNARRIGSSAADVSLRLGGDQFRGIARLVESFAVAVPGVFIRAPAILVGPGVGRTGERAVGVIEAVVVRAPLGPRAEVPFPGMEGGVAERPQGRGERDRAGGEGPEVARGDRMRPEAARVAARHQGGPRRRADGLHVVAVEFHAFPNKPVHGGRLAIAPVPADISPAQVVGHDQENVGPRRFGGGRGNASAGGEHHRGHHP